MASEDDSEQQGGRILHRGAYACIFEPLLRCKPGTTQTIASSAAPDAVQITKLLRKEDAQNEELVSRVLQSTPLWKNYFVLSESICEPAEKQTDPDYGRCEVLQTETGRNLRLITMPYRGTSLLLHRISLPTFDLMHFVRHLVAAGAILTLRGVVHRDLHLKNIVMDDEDVPRIIDFNLAVVNDRTASNERLMHQHHPELDQVSPDYALLNAVSQGMSVENAIRSILSQKKVLRTLRTLFGLSAHEIGESLRQFARKSKAVRSGQLMDWYRVYWRMVDSWSIGVNLVQRIMKWLLWPEFATLYEPHRTMLLPVLRRMCAVDPMERVDCVQALHQLDPTHVVLRRYGKEWLAKVGTGVRKEA